MLVSLLYLSTTLPRLALVEARLRHDNAVAHEFTNARTVRLLEHLHVLLGEHIAKLGVAIVLVAAPDGVQAFSCPDQRPAGLLLLCLPLFIFLRFLPKLGLDLSEVLLLYLHHIAIHGILNELATFPLTELALLLRSGAQCDILLSDGHFVPSHSFIPVCVLQHSLVDFHAMRDEDSTRQLRKAGTAINGEMHRPFHRMQDDLLIFLTLVLVARHPDEFQETLGQVIPWPAFQHAAADRPRPDGMA
mmetsp:Transcript_92417/g.198116  ORF Transcript_92417/g.198116 Transcript_92417/m.198116 type:complete len:246 (+) Transcript_92417:136-873(+)